jgi:thymidylate synthase (FAD)
MTKEIRVLDHGYVRLVTYTPWNMVELEQAILDGDLERARELLTEHDLSAVNAARASFAKESDKLTNKDTNLIDFLADAEPVPHTSPFRHNHVTLEINCPLIVARQWWRHAVGASTTEDGTPWSELSRRYVRGGIQVHVPYAFRSKPSNAKQGSGPPLDDTTQKNAEYEYVNACDTAIAAYDSLISLGVAPEQARMVLPQGVYTSFRWSPSVQALTNFWFIASHQMHNTKLKYLLTPYMN